MTKDDWGSNIVWEIEKPKRKKKADWKASSSSKMQRSSWKEEEQLKKVQEIMGSEWTYDKVKNVFRHKAARPWFTFNPDTNQYHDEKEGLFYDWNGRTENFDETPERKSKKFEYVKNFKRSLKEFLKHVTSRGVPRSQLLSSTARLRRRAVEEYPNAFSKISVSTMLEEATKELLKETAGNYSDSKGKNVVVLPPYTCPLCGRTTSDPETLLAHVKLHEYCTKRGLLPQNVEETNNEKLSRLFRSEALFVVGNKDVQRAVEMSVNKSGRNNRKRYQAYTYMKRRMGIGEDEDFSCDVIHAVRAAFPEAHGCYSGRHLCKSFEIKQKEKYEREDPVSAGLFGYQPTNNPNRGSIFL